MEHIETRRDLAAVLRWTARLNMHEGIANHYSAAISNDGTQFLMNPYGVHWSKMRASEPQATRRSSQSMRHGATQRHEPLSPSIPMEPTMAGKIRILLPSLNVGGGITGGKVDSSKS